MKSVLVKMYKGLMHGLELGARERLRQELLGYSERRLEDMGFSSAKLMQGLSAWPWRIEEAVVTDHVADITQINAKAMEELEQYSDRELADLGISRSGIYDAVVNGRPGTSDLAA